MSSVPSAPRGGARPITPAAMAHTSAPRSRILGTGLLPPADRWLSLDLEKTVDTSDVDPRSARAFASGASLPTASSPAIWPRTPRAKLGHGGAQADRSRHDHRGHGDPRHADACDGCIRSAEARGGHLPSVRSQRGVRGLPLRALHRRSVHPLRDDEARPRGGRGAPLAGHQLGGPHDLRPLRGRCGRRGRRPGGRQRRRSRERHPLHGDPHQAARSPRLSSSPAAAASRRPRTR